MPLGGANPGLANLMPLFHGVAEQSNDRIDLLAEEIGPLNEPHLPDHRLQKTYGLLLLELRSYSAQAVQTAGIT